MTGTAKIHLLQEVSLGFIFLTFFSTGLVSVVAAATPTPVVPTLITNGELTGAGTYPSGWYGWRDDHHDPDATVYLGAAGNSWVVWDEAGIYQDAFTGFSAGDLIYFGAYLLTPSGDRLQDGFEYGYVALEFWDSSNNLLSAVTASPVINSLSSADTWIFSGGVVNVPPNTDHVRILIRMGNGNLSAGKFNADQAFMRNLATYPLAPTVTPTPTVSAEPTEVRFVPERYGAARPNPFMPGRGQKTFFLPESAASPRPSIRIVNLRGEKVRVLENARSWDGRDDSGRLCEGGIYFYQIETGAKPVSGSVVLIR
ncbi:MAG: hypothetical protein HGA76_01860 [Candidatus Firestonebacteria bacterium]|nr:hypothetical protein [Candidatus Firestonebacteria bacterium]